VTGNGPITVGILEDHRLMLQSLTWLLEGAGFLVTAKSGEPGSFLAQIAERPPQVALIDLTLESFTNAPAASGVDVVRELRENHPQIRTLVLSATHTTEMVDRCYHEGAAGYLYKLTATRETLTDAIREVAMGKRLFPVQLLASSVSDGHIDRRPNLLDGVTDREREVLAYLSTGADNVQISQSLGITERTVKAHVSNLYRKLRMKNRVELALLARQQGLKVPQRSFAPESSTPPASST
jgi:two-component system, NarL family, nitrate/nitrite response regulator NarL